MLHTHYGESRPGRQRDCDRSHEEDEQVPLNLRIDVVDDGGPMRRSDGRSDHAIPDLMTRDQKKVNQEEDDDEMTCQGQHRTHGSLNESSLASPDVSAACPALCFAGCLRAATQRFGRLLNGLGVSAQSSQRFLARPLDGPGQRRGKIRASSPRAYAPLALAPRMRSSTRPAPASRGTRYRSSHATTGASA